MKDHLPQFFASNFEPTVQITFSDTRKTFWIIVPLKNHLHRLLKPIKVRSTESAILLQELYFCKNRHVRHIQVSWPKIAW